MDAKRTAVIGALAVAFVACEGSLLRITVDGEARTRVGAGSLLEDLLGDLGFEDLVALDVTASEELRNQGVRPGDIAEARLTRFDLAAVSPDGADLSFVDRIDVFVSAPGLPEVRVASGSDFPSGVPEVALALSEVDLTDHVVSRELTVRTDVTGRRPDEEVTVEARWAIRVGVTSQGACNYLRRDDEGGGDTE